MQDTLIGVSASDNILEDPAAAAALKYRKDIALKRHLQTIPIYRGDVNGRENNKFLYPLEGVPVVAYTLLHAVDQGAQVRCVGNDETGRLVGLINSLWGSSIEFVHEGSDLSLANSFHKLFDGHIRKHNYFVCGDVPFASGYALSDYSGDLVLDWNADKLLADYVYLTRNFYTKGRVDGKTHHFKEPNIYYFSSQKGLDLICEVADHFHANRKGGGLYTAITAYIGKKGQDNDFAEAYRKNKTKFWWEALKSRAHKSRIPVPAINFARVSEVARDFYGINVSFMFWHDDVFRLLDMDGLNNDWVLYQQLVMQLTLDHRMDERITQLKGSLANHKEEFPCISAFDEILLGYVSELNKHLGKPYKLATESVSDFTNEMHSREPWILPAMRELLKVPILSSQQPAQPARQAYQALPRG